MDETILAGQRVFIYRGDNGVGDSVEPRHRDQGRLGVECFGSVHVWHDLVARFDQIIRHVLRRDFGEAKLRFGIDEAGIDRHACGVDDLRAARDVDRARGANRDDLAPLHDDHATLDYAVGDGQQLATF